MAASISVSVALEFHLFTAAGKKTPVKLSLTGQNTQVMAQWTKTESPSSAPDRRVARLHQVSLASNIGKYHPSRYE